MSNPEWVVLVGFTLVNIAIVYSSNRWMAKAEGKYREIIEMLEGATGGEGRPNACP